MRESEPLRSGSPKTEHWLIDRRTTLRVKWLKNLSSARDTEPEGLQPSPEVDRHN